MGGDAWRGYAAVFSGRPDPVWEIPPAEPETLTANWEALPPTTDVGPQPPLLGYRGSTLTAPSGAVWRAYGGIVEASAGDWVERRADPNRR